MTRIEIFADIACPWCYIAERRLDRALANRPGRDVEKVWRPYMLQPDLPTEGVPWPKYVEEKWGGMEQAESMLANVSAVAESEGIRFDWPNLATAPNTLDAHRLILFAERRGREWAVADALYKAHFTEGRDIGDRDVLAEIAAAEELDIDDARNWLRGGTGTSEVTASQRAAGELGVQSVPFFVFDNKLAVSGAQPYELFLEVLDRCELQDAPVS